MKLVIRAMGKRSTPRKAGTYYDKNRTKQIEYQRKYSKKHPKPYSPEYYQAHKEQRKAVVKKSYTKHKAARVAKMKEYRETTWRYMEYQRRGEKYED